MKEGRYIRWRTSIWKKEAKKRSFRALQFERSKEIFCNPCPTIPPKSHPLAKPHFPPLMEEVPSNKDSYKPIRKMNRENTKCVQNYCNRKNFSADQNTLPPSDSKAEISIA